MSQALAIPRPALGRLEPAYVTVIKALLYAFALALYLWPLSSLLGIASAVAMALLAMVLARAALRRRLRASVVLLGVPVLATAATFLGNLPLNSRSLAGELGLEGSFVASDLISFGLLAFAAVFLLRYLAGRLRAFSLLEVAFVAGSAALLLSDHQNRMINQPRFLSDWAWSLGINPATVLVGIGAAAALAAALLFLRDQPLLKLVTSLLLLLLLGLLYYSISDKRVVAASSDALGLSGKGKGNQSKGGSSKNPFKNNYPQPPPQPVAVAILRDDYQAEAGVMYFRQRTLSKYNGVHLTAAPEEDKDVITSFGETGHKEIVSPQAKDHHREVPTTMYLLVDHPQPPALSHAHAIKLIQNPNPQQFVAAYDVKSLVPTVPPRRLLGRHSVPEGWSKERIAHYTAYPDDPRYRALSDIIVRHLDPRFASDDMARAYAIKRYLERKGFYTRKSKHASAKDPTASFLFGDLRGYCVHFAHAAVYLFRSQGIAARVALGYAVQTKKRAGGSSVLIMGDRAHAWPEIYLEGIGWVTFDIYPERTDLPAPELVDYDLEKLLGELARKDPTGGKTPDGKTWQLPWGAVGRVLLSLVAALLALLYGIKLARFIAPGVVGDAAYCRWAYRSVLDRLAEQGHQRRVGETREHHATRLAGELPLFDALTEAHLARAMGSPSAPDSATFRELVRRTKCEMKSKTSFARRLLGLFDPSSWLRAR